MTQTTPQAIHDQLAASKRILIMQADNPDGDSVASALALEQILHELGKEPFLYCAVDIPKHLQHLQGWDRVSKDIPKDIDCAIIVDCSARSLFELADKAGHLQWIVAKPLIVLDHHPTEATLTGSHYYCNDSAVATGEIIYDLAVENKWPLSEQSRNMLAVSILSDSLGLMTSSTTPHSIRVIADLVEQGVKLPELEEARRETMKKSRDLVHYKGALLQRVEYHDNDRIAIITIPWEEIEMYSNDYNPSMLVIDDMRLTENVKIAIAFKTYQGKRITAKIRCNYGFPIAGQLAESFGGGGHAYASGFKVEDGRDFEDLKNQTIYKAAELLEALASGGSHAHL
jgi:bifunctional oligoribonuclease and PAP phosphatase NrnA